MNERKWESEKGRWVRKISEKGGRGRGSVVREIYAEVEEGRKMGK